MIPSARRRLPAAFVLSAAVALGCGGSADSPPDAAPLDACELFTFEDAQSIAGESVAVMASTLDEARGRDPGQCLYNSGTLARPRQLSLQIRTHRTPERARRFQESSRSTLKAMSGGSVQDVPGLGDGAIWVGGRIQQLHLLLGGRQFIVTVQSPDGTDQLPQARQIAGRVLARVREALTRAAGFLPTLDSGVIDAPP